MNPFVASMLKSRRLKLFELVRMEGRGRRLEPSENRPVPSHRLPSLGLGPLAMSKDFSPLVRLAHNLCGPVSCTPASASPMLVGRSGATSVGAVCKLLESHDSLLHADQLQMALCFGSDTFEMDSLEAQLARWQTPGEAAEG